MKEKCLNNGELQKRFPETFLLENEYWQVMLSSCGGQILKAVTSLSPEDVIFLGEKAAWSSERSIRGGVPVCWPWFGASPVPGRPIQGFARTARWEMSAFEKDFLRMKLPVSAVPAEFVDFPFELVTEVKVTEHLEIALVMKNTADVPVRISCALHTYFAVSDCEKVSVTGLEQTPYTVKGGAVQFGENTPLKIKGEVCRLYYPQRETVEILDPRWGRKVIVSKENSSSTLVWNPGAERCRQITDLNDDEYRRFLCVECNRAGEDEMELAPGEEYRIVQKIKVEALPTPE